MQCLPFTDGGTKRAEQQGHCVLHPPPQQDSLGLAEVTKDVRSSWPFTMDRVPGGGKGVYVSQGSVVPDCGVL